MNLTTKQKSVLEFIQRFYEDQQCQPSYRDIQDEFGFKSKNSAAQYVQQLQHKGYLDFENGAFQSTVQIKRKTTGARQIEILGSVAAGYLTEAIEEKQHIDIASSQLEPSQDYFALKVLGDSMIGENIIEGDTVILKKSDHLKNGMLGVVKVEGEATLKRVFATENGLRLVPSNPNFKPIEVKKEESPVLLGEVVKVIREF